MSEQEAEWLVLALEGDPDAFGELVEIYQRPVYNLCYRMLGDPNEAEEAAQEAFLRSYRSLRRYDRSRPFATWLLSIAAHYCIDQIRKRRLTVVSIEDMPYLDLSGDGPDPETETSRNEQEQRIQRMLATLTPLDRAAVVMYYWYEYSYKEISAALDLTESAVKSRLHRARRALAEAWHNQDQQIQATERSQHDELRSPAY